VADTDDWNAGIIEEFRANGGKVGGVFEGRPLLLLHTTGAKSGEPRLSPLMYQAVGDGYAIFASKAGAPTNPAWFHNLKAHPDVEIEVGDATVAVAARVATGEEREQIWSRQKQDYSFFADYEAKAGREIPVIVLEPHG
jgi:deazaflavin-dependent oxidoreductase (nitroreductase family)